VWMSVLFGAKTSDFLKFMMCPHGQGGGVKGVLNPNFRPFSFELKKLDFLK